MRFMLVFIMPEDTWVEKDIIRRIVQWKLDKGREGIFLGGNPLKPAAMTHTVRRDAAGNLETVDGPVHDHGDVFYAYEILKADSLEHALEIARQHPATDIPDTQIEVREIWDTIDQDSMGEEYYKIAPNGTQ